MEDIRVAIQQAEDELRRAEQDVVTKRASLQVTGGGDCG